VNFRTISGISKKPTSLVDDRTVASCSLNIKIKSKETFTYKNVFVNSILLMSKYKTNISINCQVAYCKQYSHFEYDLSQCCGCGSSSFREAGSGSAPKTRGESRFTSKSRAGDA